MTCRLRPYPVSSLTPHPSPFLLLAPPWYPLLSLTPLTSSLHPRPKPILPLPSPSLASDHHASRRLVANHIPPSQPFLSPPLPLTPPPPTRFRIWSQLNPKFGLIACHWTCDVRPLLPQIAPFASPLPSPSPSPPKFGRRLPD